MNRSHELEAILRRFWKAAIDQDVTTFSNVILDHPETRSILTADDEWFRAPSDAAAGVLIQRLSEIGVVGVEFERLEGFEHGDVGWVAAEITMLRSDADPLRVRHTYVFILESGLWKVVQFHASVGIPNANTFGYKITATLADLIDSLDEKAIESVASVARTGTVTLMFTDIVGSTTISEEVGDAEWSDLIGTHFEMLHRTVEPRGGTVVKTLGDGAMVAFEAANPALTAAVELQEANASSRLPMRVGVHTGDAMHLSDDYAGTTVNKAARITAAASGGEVLVSAATAELADSRVFEFGRERMGSLKGLSGTHRLIPLVWQQR